MRELMRRLAWKTLRLTGYQLEDIWDSWRLVLANADDAHEHTIRRRLNAYLVNRQIQGLLTSRAIDLVIDVGAFQGDFSHKIRKLGYGGNLLAIEPNPELKGALEHLASRDPKFFLREEAVGSESRRVQLSVPRVATFASTQPFREDAARIFGELTATDLRSFEVDQRPLRSIIEMCDLQGSRSVLLKCDAQGSDREVIASLGDLLNAVNVLLVEVPCIPIYQSSGTLSGDNAYYESLGFRAAGAYPVSWTEHDEVVEFDLLYVRDQKASREGPTGP